MVLPRYLRVPCAALQRGAVAGAVLGLVGTPWQGLLICLATQLQNSAAGLCAPARASLGLLCLAA